ncbi:MAG: hypothetical protein ACOY7T_10140 [Pseudomonadota bacterium]
MTNLATSLNAFFPIQAPKSGDGPTELDRHIMQTFGLSEDEYFKQLKTAKGAEPIKANSVRLKSLGSGSAMKLAVNPDDERIMKLFGMNETEWQSAVAADKAKRQHTGSTG